MNYVYLNDSIKVIVSSTNSTKYIYRDLRDMAIVCGSRIIIRMGASE